jgi:DNA repair exonuclease SbcCD ATPase subunit
MLTKNQLQQEVQNLETKLQEFREQLNTYNSVTIETAGVGDTLEDGSIVLQKSNGIALLVSPKNTEVKEEWTKEFPGVFQKLKEEGFNPSQWFVPTLEQLKLAYRNIPNEFSSTNYWSSTEFNANRACIVYFTDGNARITYDKASAYCVRAFRCVTY